MLEKHIISDTQRREVMDSMSGRTTDQRLDQLLDILRTTVKVDESIFDWFIQVLRDYSTVLSMNTADKLKARYDGLLQPPQGIHTILISNKCTFMRRVKVATLRLIHRTWSKTYSRSKLLVLFVNEV